MKLKKFLLAPLGALIAGLMLPAAWAVDSDTAPAASSSRAGVVVPFSEVQKRDSAKRKPQPADVWKAKNGNELKKQEKAQADAAAKQQPKSSESEAKPKPAPQAKPAPAPKPADAAKPVPKPADAVKPAPAPKPVAAEEKKSDDSAAAPKPAPKNEAAAPAAKPSPAVKAEAASSARNDAVPAKEEKDAAPAESSGNVRYVSDRLFTFVRTGPGNNYKIAGSVNSGDKVILKGSNGKYSEIIDRKGRDVWILTDELQSGESAPVKIERLEQENKDLKFKLENVDSESVRELKKKTAELDALTGRASSLEKSLKEGEEKLKELTEDNAELKEKSENIETIEKQQWFMKGAGMVIIGFILGVIFVYLPSPRKKRSTFGGW